MGTLSCTECGNEISLYDSKNYDEMCSSCYNDLNEPPVDFNAGDLGNLLNNKGLDSWWNRLSTTRAEILLMDTGATRRQALINRGMSWKGLPKTAKPKIIAAAKKRGYLE